MFSAKNHVSFVCLINLNLIFILSPNPKDDERGLQMNKNHPKELGKFPSGASGLRDTLSRATEAN